MGFYQVQDGSNAKIHFEIIEGVLPEDTVFLHGNMASNAWWGPAEQVWANQSKRQQKGSMILVEFRGCGESTPPRSQADVDMKLFSQDFIGLIRSLNRGKVNLVGHSTGGLIAAIMLAQAPELFSKAVLLDPVGAKGVTFQEAMTAAFEQMKTSKELVALVMGSTIHNNNPDGEFFKKVVIEHGFHAVNTVGDKVLRALDGLNVVEMMKTVTHPVLVLHGEHDALLPISDSKELASLMKNGVFETIPGQGHCSNVENPEKFVSFVNKFLFP